MCEGGPGLVSISHGIAPYVELYGFDFLGFEVYVGYVVEVAYMVYDVDRGD